MIRPELAAQFRRWAEPALATAATLFALWVAGATTLRWGWLTLILSAIILLGGGLWIREAVRRVRFSSGESGGGRVFVEEHRILYVGAIGNVQIELDDVMRVDLAMSKPNGKSWVSVLLHTTSGPPAAVPLNAEGQDEFIDALCSLPGFRFDALNSAILKQRAAGRFAPLVTFWTRGTASG